MSFFTYLDNKFRNFSLDAQQEFSLAKDGYQKACHQWVLMVRKIHMALYFCVLPFLYVFQSIGIIRQDQDYSTRVAELKAMSEKLLAEARAAQVAGAPVPINQDTVDRVLTAPIPPKPNENN